MGNKGLVDGGWEGVGEVGEVGRGEFCRRKGQVYFNYSVQWRSTAGVMRIMYMLVMKG